MRSKRLAEAAVLIGAEAPANKSTSRRQGGNGSTWTPSPGRNLDPGTTFPKYNFCRDTLLAPGTIYPARRSGGLFASCLLVKNTLRSSMLGPHLSNICRAGKLFQNTFEAPNTFTAANAGDQADNGQLLQCFRAVKHVFAQRTGIGRQ